MVKGIAFPFWLYIGLALTLKLISFLYSFRVSQQKDIVVDMYG